MANQRKKGVERVTLTIPDDMLARLESDAEQRGIDRLALMREVLDSYLKQRPKEADAAKRKS
jgi:metal-responsive CopG/Arc/MetJ family transcriptional regulator